MKNSEPAPFLNPDLQYFLNDRSQNDVSILDHNQIRALVLYVADDILVQHHVDATRQVQQHIKLILHSILWSFSTLLHFYGEENKILLTPITVTRTLLYLPHIKTFPLLFCPSDLGCFFA